MAMVVVCLAAAGLLIFPDAAMDSAKNAVALCLNVVVPSLFPFFVLSSLAVDLGVAQYAGVLCGGMMRKLFNVSGACAPAFLLGLIGGYPVGAKTAVAIYEKGLCSKTEAERLLAFCNNSGPAFILGSVGAGLLKSGAAGWLLYLAHALASITTGLVFRFYKIKQARTNSPVESCPIVSTKILDAFLKSVTSGFASILNICAFVIFFAVAIRMLYKFGLIPLAAQILALPLSLLGLTAADAERLIAGMIEITSGLFSLTASGTPLNATLAMAAFMLGWAGLSVHCQVLSFIRKSDLSFYPYFTGKLLSAAFATLYILLLSRVIPLSVPTSAGLVSGIDSVASLSFGSSLSLSLLTSVLLWGAFLLPALFIRRRERAPAKARRGGGRS